MNGFLIRLISNAAAIMILPYILDGIRVEGVGSALAAALVFGIANAIIRPIIVIFTLPVNILTLGLFTLVINGFILQIVSGIIDGFKVRGLGTAILGSILLSIISSVVSKIIR